MSQVLYRRTEASIAWPNVVETLLPTVPVALWQLEPHTGQWREPPASVGAGPSLPSLTPPPRLLRVFADARWLLAIDNGDGTARCVRFATVSSDGDVAQPFDARIKQPVHLRSDWARFGLGDARPAKPGALELIEFRLRAAPLTWLLRLRAPNLTPLTGATP